MALAATTTAQGVAAQDAVADGVVVAAVATMVPTLLLRQRGLPPPFSDQSGCLRCPSQNGENLMTTIMSIVCV